MDVRRAVGWVVVVALAPPAAHAGLSLDEALARHRALLEATGDSALTSLTPALAAPDSIVLGASSRREWTPPLLRPGVDGSGVQLLYGAIDPEGFGWRLGLGWSDTVGRRGERFNGGFNLDGSELSAPLGAGRVYASVQRRHWGPSWAGSLILDAGAAPLPAIGWRTSEPLRFANPWFAWLGPWSADVFVATLGGHSQPERPRLWGGRFQFMPFEGFEVGLSRVVEWGGRGREENFGTLWRALLGRDNVEDGAYNPSNQLGGFDLRYRHRLGERSAVSIYAQAIGEDEAGGLPATYLGSAGVDLAFEAGAASWRVFVERADTVAGGFSGHGWPGVAYQHSIYLQGYTQQGRPLGFPAGGDVMLTSLGLLVERTPYAGMLVLHHGRAHPDAQLAPPGRLAGVDAQVAWKLAAADRVGATLTHWRDPASTQTRLQLWWQHLLR
ncbi:MAG TPA: capsule assembly Wzi family protein [Burkholderiaceae bacterium]|nr:capsule assembly Wzi family protein [Burkholderiaceae bacterium]